MVTIKPGETYRHTDHGEIRVEGIWREVTQYDTETGTAADSDQIIVSFATYYEYGALDEQTYQLDAFIDGLDNP